MKLVIVSGLSESGKSIALSTLEDLGYYCIDNLPVSLLQSFATELAKSRRSVYDMTGVGIDARNLPENLKDFPQILANIKDAGVQCELLLLGAETQTLLKRFSETRRRHPLTGPQRTLADAIAVERDLLGPISARADMFIDTTHLNVHQLRELIRARLGEAAVRTLSLLFQSFGFKHGVPSDADFVFDVRCLPNPHWETRLRPLTGQDPQVASFLESHPPVARMFEDLKDFLERWIPHFEAGDRSYLTVAVGCTGGQHRSVYLAERLARHFRHVRKHVLARHREL